jgi:hypothetical protein
MIKVVSSNDKDSNNSILEKSLKKKKTTVKKRGRKPLNSTKIVDNDKLQNFMNKKQDEECMVMNIPLVDSDEPEQELYQNDSEMVVELRSEIKELQKKLQQYDMLERAPTLEHSCCHDNVQMIDPETGEPIEKSPFACWWCCDTFSTKPIFLPYDIRYNTKNTKSHFLVMGNFCSTQCAQAFNCDLKDSNIQKRTHLLSRLYDIKDTTPALPRLLLERFGGPFPISEWRLRSKLNLQHGIVHHHPMVGIGTSIELSSQKSIVDENGKPRVVFNQKNVPVSNNPANYVLKRKKPLPSKYSSMKSSLGLVSKSSD